MVKEWREREGGGELYIVFCDPVGGCAVCGLSLRQQQQSRLVH